MFEPRDYWERCFEGIDPETYDFSKSKPASVLAGFCDNYLKDGATVLDLGCGGGRNAHYLAQRGDKVCGVDIATAAVESFARIASPVSIFLGPSNREHLTVFRFLATSSPV